MRILTITLAAVCLCGALAAQAQQIPATPDVRVGFFLGKDFQVGAANHHIEGFEIGGEIPLVKNLNGVGGISLSPTVVIGGSNRKGPDTDGYIYRLLLTVKRQVNNQGVYIGAGAGYSWTAQRDNKQFSNTQGVATQLMVGYDFRCVNSRSIQPFAEIGLHDGGNNKVRGWSFDLGARF